MTLSQRRLREHDAEAIAHLDAISRGSSWTAEAWRATLQARCIAVGLEANETGGDGLALASVASLAAFAVFSYVLDEAELLFIAVHPEKRGQGLGRRVLRAAYAALDAEGITAVHLEVAATNTPARALYDAEGFSQVGCRKGYYPDGDDAVLMTLVAPFPS